MLPPTNGAKNLKDQYTMYVVHIAKIGMLFGSYVALLVDEIILIDNQATILLLQFKYTDTVYDVCMLMCDVCISFL